MNGREVTSFTVSTGERAAVLRARGELDTVSAREFRRALDGAAATGRPLVVVDLEGVTFLDSAGLAVVFGVQRELPPAQRLVLGNVPSRVLRTLRLAGVVAVLEAHAEGEPQPWRDEVGDDSGATGVEPPLPAP